MKQIQTIDQDKLTIFDTELSRNLQQALELDKAGITRFRNFARHEDTWVFGRYAQRANDPFQKVSIVINE